MKLFGTKYYIKKPYQNYRQAGDTNCYKETWGGDKHISCIVSFSGEMNIYEVQDSENIYSKYIWFFVTQFTENKIFVIKHCSSFSYFN